MLLQGVWTLFVFSALPLLSGSNLALSYGQVALCGVANLLQGHTAPVLSNVSGTQKGLSPGAGRQHVLGTAFHTSMDVFCFCRS